MGSSPPPLKEFYMISFLGILLGYIIIAIITYAIAPHDDDPPPLLIAVIWPMSLPICGIYVLGRVLRKKFKQIKRDWPNRGY